MIDRIFSLSSLVVERGKHSRPGDGMCAMEMVSFLAHEPFSDSPECASPVIGSYVRSLNDWMNDMERQRLKGYIPLIIGSWGPREKEFERVYMLADFVVNEAMRRIVQRAGLYSYHEELASLSPIVDEETRKAAWPGADRLAKEIWDRRRLYDTELSQQLRAEDASWLFAATGILTRPRLDRWETLASLAATVDVTWRIKLPLLDRLLAVTERTPHSQETVNRLADLVGAPT